MVSARWSVFSSSTWGTRATAARTAALRPAGPDPTMATLKASGTSPTPHARARNCYTTGLVCLSFLLFRLLLADYRIQKATANLEEMIAEIGQLALILAFLV